MRTNYNDSSRNGGRFPKRQNSGGKGGSGGSNGGGRDNRRPQGRRPGGHSGGGAINASGATSARNKYLELAKEALSNGNRVEAENYFQHAEHYSKVLNAAMENRREREESQPAEQSNHRRHYNNPQPEQQAPHDSGADSGSAPEASPEAKKIEPENQVPQATQE